ncbi:MAG: TolB family protein [Planctomycetota bacterium]
MAKKYHITRKKSDVRLSALCLLSSVLCFFSPTACWRKPAVGAVNDAFYGPPAVPAYAEASRGGGQVQNRRRLKKVPSPRTELKLEEIGFKILFETYRETGGKDNWELYLMNADGSDPVNLTNTPDVDEMYPHASPDGTKICFVVDEEIEREPHLVNRRRNRSSRTKTRGVYYMNIDGTGRVKVAENTRQPCWSPDSKRIAYVKGEYERYSTREYATSQLFIYDLQTRQHRLHPNRALHHIYAICWSPDGNWFLAAIHGGMGYSDTIIAFEANGTRVFDLGPLGVKGCRPDLSRDGRKMTWGETDWDLFVADIDLTSHVPQVANIRKVVTCLRAAKVYHVDFSPDGRYITFSFGSVRGAQQVGGKARGWNICVSDLTGKWVKITMDGNHNKEPDWVPIRSMSP